MFKLNEFPPVRAIDYLQTSPETFRRALHEDLTGIGLRAAIFRTIDDVAHMLLLQRASTDSLPERWELPGGGVEDDDFSLKDSLYREIREETGLTPTWLVQEVGSGQRWHNHKGRFLCVTFIAEVEEIERLELSSTDPAHKSSTTSNPDFIGDVPVRLAAAEHQDYAFFTEQQVKDGVIRNGQIVRFTSDATRATMLQAFVLQREIIAAKKRV